MIMLSNFTIRQSTCLLRYSIWSDATGLVHYVIQFDDTPLDLLIMLYNLTIRHWICWLCYRFADTPLDLLCCTIWRNATGLVDYIIQFDDTPMDILIMLSNLVISHWTCLCYPIWRYATGLLQPVQVSFNGWNSLAVNDYCYLTGTVCRWCCLIYQSYVALSATLVLAIRWGSETWVLTHNWILMDRLG
jgi:hypothetical protein